MVVEALAASAGGALRGAAAIWCVANQGLGDQLCSLGAVRGLKVLSGWGPKPSRHQITLMLIGPSALPLHCSRSYLLLPLHYTGSEFRPASLTRYVDHPVLMVYFHPTTFASSIPLLHSPFPRYDSDPLLSANSFLTFTILLSLVTST